MLIKINGTTRHYSRITAVSALPCRGHWQVTGIHGQWHISGGKAAGGTSRDWFVEGSHINGYLNATSLVDALHLIDTL